jgi:hypothetical protein
METIEQPRTEVRPTSGLALVVICLGYFMAIVDTNATGVNHREASCLIRTTSYHSMLS